MFSNCISLVACSKLTSVRIERDACTALDCTLICPVRGRELRVVIGAGSISGTNMQVVAWGWWRVLQKCIMVSKGLGLCVGTVSVFGKWARPKKAALTFGRRR